MTRSGRIGFIGITVMSSLAAARMRKGWSISRPFKGNGRHAHILTSQPITECVTHNTVDLQGTKLMKDFVLLHRQVANMLVRHCESSLEKVDMLLGEGESRLGSGELTSCPGEVDIGGSQIVLGRGEMGLRHIELRLESLDVSEGQFVLAVLAIGCRPKRIVRCDVNAVSIGATNDWTANKLVHEGAIDGIREAGRCRIRPGSHSRRQGGFEFVAEHGIIDLLVGNAELTDNKLHTMLEGGIEVWILGVNLLKVSPREIDLRLEKLRKVWGSWLGSTFDMNSKGNAAAHFVDSHYLCTGSSGRSQ
jgi:hypothetical protein